MRFKHRIKLEHGPVAMDIVPFINVIFLLFTFFILLPLLTSPSEIQVKLPKAVTSDVIKEENYVITISSENVIYLNNKVVTLQELGSALKKAKAGNNPILIKSDRRASVSRMVDVWDLGRNLGIEKINIATNQEL